jgi:inorganic triphosphatase YgiF
VLSGERPTALADEIAGLTTLARHALVPAGTVDIVDVYLDTPRGDLRRRRDSLRIRNEGGETLVTFKGPGRRVKGGAIEREEIEMPWSEKAYARVLELLSARKVPIRPASPGREPAITLAESGLVPIQERATRRHLRDVVDEGQRIAEFAVDEVTYQLPLGPVRHHEVEIEAKGPGGPAFLSRAVKDLEGRYGPALKRWPHGKLATGFAIARLLASPEGAGMVADGHLTPAAYPRLAALLSAETIAPPE